MSEHKALLERTNHGCYFSECRCGWSGGVYYDRGAAKAAYVAHTEGRVELAGKQGTTFLEGPRAQGMSAPSVGPQR